MKKLRTSQATTADLQQFAEWLYANREQNKFDPDTFSYGSTRVLKVEGEQGPEMYLPYMLAIMSESLAPKPGMGKLGTARGIQAAIHELIRIARASGIGELYFVASDEETKRFAETHGYEPMPEGMTLMRLKTNKIQLPEECQ